MFIINLQRYNDKTLIVMFDNTTYPPLHPGHVYTTPTIWQFNRL